MDSSCLGHERWLARGVVDRISGRARIAFVAETGASLQEARVVADHGEASRVMLGWLNANGLINTHEPLGVGHRIIHGGHQFSEPTLIDEEMVAAIEALAELAPLHNRSALEAFRALRAALGPSVPMVAVFDTAFHRTLPEWAYRYAIPRELTVKHHIRRYGFHGLAHRYMVERFVTLTGRPVKHTKLITLQLGSGCSATAVKRGQSVETSMGFTPVEGLIMGTRSGDVDPTLAHFLARREGVATETVEEWLNTKSGLLGISGRSADMRELLDLERKGDELAALAIDMFCYRVRKYIGSYLAVLQGAEAIVFGGGIGQNAPQVRERILSGMEWCGLKLDSDRNMAAIGCESRISSDEAAIDIYVIPVDEALIIARDTVSCLRRKDEERAPL